MNLDNVTRPWAAVTSHLVEAVAQSDPDKFINTKGEVDLYKVLYYLGFNVAGDLYNKDVFFEPDTIVRNLELPYMTYRTGVYKGRLRKIKIGNNGTKNIYKFHKMQDLYEKYGTLQPNNIKDFVLDEEMTNILEIGKEYV